MKSKVSKKTWFHFVSTVLVVCSIAGLQRIAENLPTAQRNAAVINFNSSSASYEGLTQEESKPWVIVTGSSANHYDVSVTSLLPSIRRQVPADKVSVLYYDLGLTDAQAEELQRTFPEVEYRRFDYDIYPKHVHISQPTAGQYAWKPILLREVVYQSPHSLIFWLDGGNSIEGPLDEFFATIEKEGGYTDTTTGNMLDYTHPGMFEYFGVDPQKYKHKNETNVNGAIIGLNAKDLRIVKSLVEPWVDCALHLECIGPKGSSKGNHRQDQAALGYYWHENHIAVQKKYSGISIHNDSGRKRKKPRKKPKLGHVRMYRKQNMTNADRIALVTSWGGIASSEEDARKTLESWRQWADPWSTVKYVFGPASQRRTVHQDMVQAEYSEVKYRKVRTTHLPSWVKDKLGDTQVSHRVHQLLALLSVALDCPGCLVVWMDLGTRLEQLLEEPGPLVPPDGETVVFRCANGTDSTASTLCADEAVVVLSSEGISAVLRPALDCLADQKCFEEKGPSLLAQLKSTPGHHEPINVMFSR